MSRPSLEVADVLHRHGHMWRQSHHGHISLAQLKVMSAIESCRSAALGGPAITSRSHTTPAVTGIAPSARPVRHTAGSTHVRQICYRLTTITWSSPCPNQSVILHFKTKTLFITSCSRPLPKPCRLLQKTPNISALKSV